MDLQLLVASAVTPSLLLLWYFHSRDHHPEPRGVLLATFLFGVAILWAVVELGVMGGEPGTNRYGQNPLRAAVV